MIKIIPFFILLTGCVKIVEVPIWSPPYIEVPARPILKSDGTGSDGKIAREVSLDMAALEEYAKKQENIISAIVKQPKPDGIKAAKQ